ncbi:BrnT family toxin [Hoeflea olei]|uniref:BrnT family toxin n=1 Tax=Hoeflea olei TaxID=1480615 RepID=A0A1C1YZT2_9HYPH|nr:BrnT family toxin [Hoeflea olei]OCW58987.1 hypothetical protein AWJ14_04555 [Hoeflea olei]
MQISGFDRDEGNWPKCASNGVSKGEIEFMLLNEPMVLPDRSPITKETRFNAIGRTQDGRYLFVIFTLRGSESAMKLRPISARYMHRKEIDRYEQR